MQSRVNTLEQIVSNLLGKREAPVFEHNDLKSGEASNKRQNYNGDDSNNAATFTL